MPTSPTLDFQKLEDQLKALASASRLQLLQRLADPTLLEDIILQPTPSQAGRSPKRPISRPAVLRHLRRLSAQGVVAMRPIRSPSSQTANAYVADRARLYALVDDLRQIAGLGGDNPFDPAPTRQADPQPAGPWPPGAKLILIRGAQEGRAYGLQRREGRVHKIGRAPGCAIRLDYDAFVSMHHCDLVFDGRQHGLRPMAAAKNGTRLNWKRLPPEHIALLQPGDVVGVGRSLLVYRAT